MLELFVHDLGVVFLLSERHELRPPVLLKLCDLEPRLNMEVLSQLGLSLLIVRLQRLSGVGDCSCFPFLRGAQSPTEVGQQLLCVGLNLLCPLVGVRLSSSCHDEHFPVKFLLADDRCEFVLSGRACVLRL